MLSEGRLYEQESSDEEELNCIAVSILKVKITRDMDAHSHETNNCKS